MSNLLRDFSWRYLACVLCWSWLRPPECRASLKYTSGIEVVVCARVKVELQLFLEFRIQLVAAEQIRESVKPAHHNLFARPD
jgi:hypothetical protein